jgi:hypothetical protein
MGTLGYALGIDYRVTPYTTVDVAIASGDTNYGLPDGPGGGSSNMFQSAVYSVTRVFRLRLRWSNRRQSVRYSGPLCVAGLRNQGSKLH